MKMSNKVYDILKWIVIVFLPALTTFVGVLLKCFNVENTETILTIMIAFDTFLGSLIGISSLNYKGEK